MYWIFLFSIFAAFIWFSLNHNYWRVPVNDNYPRVLMYHSIDDSLPPSGMNMTSKKFEEQLQFMLKNSYKFYKISELKNIASAKGRKAAITFDDGFANNYSQAFPILKKHNIPATIYLSPKKPDQEFLSDMQIKEMQESGLIEFGAHTINHINLTDVSDEEAKIEMVESIKYVDEITGVKCKSFAYPYGRYDQRHVYMLRDLGIETAVTTKKAISSLDNRLEIPRLSMNGKMNKLQLIIALSRGRYRV